MSKLVNHWEIPVSTMVPYLQWAELSGGEITSWQIGRHNHASYELHIILSGQCNLFMNSTELTLQAGQGILIAPGVFHTPNSVMQPFCRLSVAFFPDEEQLHQVFPSQDTFLPFSVDKTIQELCAAIFAELKEGERFFHKELLSNQFAQLMLRVFRTTREASLAPRAEFPRPKQLDDMTVIDTFFETRQPSLRTKENLAKLLHCSERQALRKIYALYGVSFQKKQMLSRIETAKHLLHVTDKSIEEISTHVGYSNTAAFYKAFKLYTNTTPFKYRKWIKNSMHG